MVTPLYLGVRERFPQMKPLGLPLELPLGVRRVRGEVWVLETAPGLTAYFIDAPDFYQRPGLYQHEGVDYPDNSERFTFFAKAVAHLALHLPWKPEWLHLNDWQTGLAALVLQDYYRQSPPSAERVRVCMTIHNLAYQGLFPASQYLLTNLPWDYFVPAGVEFYGQLSCLKAGITYADALTTVSPSYAKEITTPEFGCGLDGLLREREGCLTGILNGVDYEEWNTINNPFLKFPYSAVELGGKAANKLELQKELNLPPNAQVPLFGNIGRLVEQKGVDIMLATLREMLTANIQFVQLGSGASEFEGAYRELARQFPSGMAVRIDFDEGLSHRIEAGCDFYLMPSRFEPCGLNQMYSLRYGTIPVVRATGGLADTVIDIRENLQSANGIKFHECSSRALAKAIHKALALYGEGELLRQFRQNGMAANFSWDNTAARFLEVYRRAGGPESQGLGVES